MKKIFSFLLIAIIAVVASISFVGCSNNELEKVSKNLTSYAITAELNDEKKTISAIEKISFLNDTGDVLEFLCFHLYPRAFREGALVKPYTQLNEATCFPAGVSFGDINIVDVYVDNKTAEFELVGQDEDILKVDLGFNLERQAKTNIEIKFNLILPNSTHRFGWYENNINLGNWYPILCIYENGEFDLTPYFSTGDPFYSNIANYDVTVLYPEKYEISSTGSLNIIKDGEYATAKINALAVRDFAICLSSNSKIETTSLNGIEISYMSCIDDEDFLTIVQIAREAIEFFSTIFGQYPYKTLTVAKTPFLYGGMEYPNLVFVSNSIDSKEELYKVVVHEIAHQWWYGIVGNNEIKEAWLDESLAEYSTALFFDSHKNYGITYDELISQAMSSYLLYVDVVSTIRGDVNTQMDLAVNEYQNDYEYSYMVYIKGVIMFDSLKNMVGKDKVVAGLKKYFRENKFKNATKLDFFEAFKTACHKDLNGFFEGFLDGSTIISNIN